MAYSEIEISQEVGGLPAELGIQGESPFRLELALFRVREMDFRSESTDHLREGDIETHVVVHSDSVSHTNRVHAAKKSSGFRIASGLAASHASPAAALAASNRFRVGNRLMV